MQWVKNPISPCNLILVAVIQIAGLGLAATLSYYGMVKDTCDMQSNYRFHYYYLIFIALALLPTDLYAHLSNINIQDQLALQTYSLVERKKPLSLNSLLFKITFVLLNLLCSAS
jgi:hypothetical protein